MRAVARCTLVAVVLMAFGAAGCGAFLLFAAEWLATSDPPESADVILILAGNPSRALLAVELYSKGFAPQVYVSKPVHTHSQKLLGKLDIPYPPQEQLTREVLVKKGVPAERIHYLGNALMSTVDEARAVHALGAIGWRTLLVVTSPYHVRRAKMVFGEILPQVRVVVVANPHEPYPKRWWTDQDVARNVALEIVKIAYYLAGGQYTSDAHQQEDR